MWVPVSTLSSIVIFQPFSSSLSQEVWPHNCYERVTGVV